MLAQARSTWAPVRRDMMRVASGLSSGVPWKLVVAGAVVASTTVLSACASDPRPATQGDCAAKGTCKEPPITSATATIAREFVLGHSETSSSAKQTVHD